MKLIRYWNINDYYKREVSGPVEGGRFFALKNANDLPLDLGYSEHDLYFLTSNGRLWLSPFGKEQWEEIKDGKNIPDFKTGIDDGFTVDGDEYCRPTFSPYLPELYWIPTTGRGKKHLRRSEKRSFSRSKWDL